VSTTFAASLSPRNTKAHSRLETDANDATSILVPTSLDPQDAYTYSYHITQGLEAFFHPEAGIFGACSTPFPPDAYFQHLRGAGGDKGFRSPAWNKTISYFSRGQVCKTLELFLMGHVT